MGSGIGLEAKVHGAWYRAFDDLSSYFLCSNDSNGIRMSRKLIGGTGMGRNLVRENGVCARSCEAPLIPRGAKSRPAR